MIVQYINISMVSLKLSKYLLPFIRMKLWLTMMNIRTNCLINTSFLSSLQYHAQILIVLKIHPYVLVLFLIVFTEAEVYNTLIYLDPNKASTGIDGICPKILKCCALAFFHPLCYLFNLTLSSGTIPS